MPNNNFSLDDVEQRIRMAAPANVMVDQYGVPRAGGRMAPPTYAPTNAPRIPVPAAADEPEGDPFYAPPPPTAGIPRQSSSIASTPTQAAARGYGLPPSGRYHPVPREGYGEMQQYPRSQYSQPSSPGAGPGPYQQVPAQLELPSQQEVEPQPRPAPQAASATFDPTAVDSRDAPSLDTRVAPPGSPPSPHRKDAAAKGVSGRRQTDASERSVSGRRHTDERRSMGRRQQTEQSIAPSVLTSDTGGDARAGRGANRFCSPVFCGVLIVCFLFFAPLVGLFFMQHGGMSATEHEATTGPYFCRDMPPLAVRNRSSGLPVGFSDLAADPANGCADGCAAAVWPDGHSTPSVISAAAALGALSVEHRKPAPGAPIPLFTLQQRLAPPGVDFNPACDEHDRCYATWRRSASARSHRAACDDELMANLHYACWAVAGRPGTKFEGEAGSGPPSVREKCELIVQLTAMVAHQSNYTNSQELARLSVESGADAGAVHTQVIGPTIETALGEPMACTVEAYGC